MQPPHLPGMSGDQAQVRLGKQEAKVPKSLSGVSSPPWDKQANAMVKVKCVLQKKVQVVPEGGVGEYTSQLPQILNMNRSNTCLGGHPIPARLQQKLAAYEKGPTTWKSSWWIWLPSLSSWSRRTKACTPSTPAT